VDEQHIEEIRCALRTFAAGGVTHLVLEVVAYAADEARARGTPGLCAVRLHADGSVLVSDDGRGTDTRADPSGRPVRKPVMGTKDLRFFDSPDPPRLPDGRPRRGISVVAAASEWLAHTNRRREGAWVQEYRHGRPAGELTALPPDGTTGTTVHFLPADAVGTAADADPAELASLASAWGPHLTVRVEDLRERSRDQEGAAGPRRSQRLPATSRKTTTRP